MTYKDFTNQMLDCGFELETVAQRAQAELLWVTLFPIQAAIDRIEYRVKNLEIDLD